MNVFADSYVAGSPGMSACAVCVAGKFLSLSMVPQNPVCLAPLGNFKRSRNKFQVLAVQR